MGPPESILRKDNIQSIYISSKCVSPTTLLWVLENNTELCHNVWCMYSICDRAKVHSGYNFDYNKPHRHKYVHRLGVLHR